MSMAVILPLPQRRTPLVPIDVPIERVECYRVHVPLDVPLRVFGHVIHEREFVFAEVHAGGQVGRGYALSRAMPILPLVEQHITPRLVGRPAGSIRAIWNEVRQSANMIGEHGVFARALALIDIALWDLQGQLLGAPLWRLLGGAAERVPLVAIAGYYQDNPVEAVRRDVEALLPAGYHRFKMPFGLDADLDQQRLAAFREVAGDTVQLGLDASAAFTSVKEALAAIQRIEPYHVAFLEDPFRASQWMLVLQLAQRSSIPIAFGESVSDIATMHALAEGVDIFRPDATHQMGITGCLQSLGMAQEQGKTIFPHYFPDIHAHLVGGAGGSMIEESPDEADTVGFRRLRATPPRIEAGFWHLSERPGLGIDWDMDALQVFRIP